MFAVADVEKVIRHLVRFGSTPSDAEDLAQEALVIAWRKQSELEPGRPLDAWLYGIAKNLYRNHARTTARRRTDALGDTELPGVDRGSLVDALAVHAAVHELPEPQQDIVILHELEGYTLKETAELLDVPFDTAKDRLKRAREQLRGRIAGPVDAGREREAMRQLSKATAAAVLAGLVTVLGKDAAAAAAGAGGAAVAGAGAARVATRWIAAAALATGAIVGVAVDRAIVRSPAPAQTEPAPVAVAAVAPSPDAALALDAGIDDAVIAHAPRKVTADAALAAALGVNAEAQVIEQARVALARGHADDALVALMSHERRFPAGQLAEERDVLLIDAYLALGNVKLARARVDQYHREFPHGLQAAKVADDERDLAQRER